MLNENQILVDYEDPDHPGEVLEGNKMVSFLMNVLREQAEFADVTPTFDKWSGNEIVPSDYEQVGVHSPLFSDRICFSVLLKNLLAGFA